VDTERAALYTSALKKPPSAQSWLDEDDEPAAFFPPELSDTDPISNWGASFEVGGAAEEGSGATLWDIAVRYHELKVRPGLQGELKRLRALSVRAILDRARGLLGSVVRPMHPAVARWEDLPHQATRVEFDLESTLDESVAGQPPEIWFQYQMERIQPVIVCLDTSLSMTGEKLALTAVALAVLLLEFPRDPVGIVTFETQANVLKDPRQEFSRSSSVEALLGRFLDLPAQGYTNLEDGLREALKLSQMAAQGANRAKVATLLLTDGKYTAGKDPAYLGGHFQQLTVLKMGRERAGLPLCRELAQRGHGALLEVSELGALPAVMMAAVRDLLRGRTMA
jgi:Mg-chelatase subunit ChlD